MCESTILGDNCENMLLDIGRISIFIGDLRARVGLLTEQKLCWGNIAW